MISILHLLWIVPLSMAFGMVVTAFLKVNENQ